MAHRTLIDGINEVLKRVGIISATGELASLTDSARQIHIDVLVQMWNEAIDKMYDHQGRPVPGETGNVPITLVQGQREYSLPSRLVSIRWPLVDQTNGFRVYEYPGGYESMREIQTIPGNYEGTPNYAAINSTTGLLRFETAPTAEEAGRVYDMFYDKDNSVEDELDEFPFTDAVFRGLVPVLAEEFENRRAQDFDPRVWHQNLGMAIAFLTKAQRRSHW